MNYKYICIALLLNLTFVGQGTEKVVEGIKKKSSAFTSWWVVVPTCVAAGFALNQVYHLATTIQLSNRIERKKKEKSLLKATHNIKILQTACSVSAEIQKATLLPPCLTDMADEYAQVGITWQAIEKELLAEKFFFLSTKTEGIPGLKKGDLETKRRFLPLTPEQKADLRRKREETQKEIRRIDVEVSSCKQRLQGTYKA